MRRALVIGCLAVLGLLALAACQSDLQISRDYDPQRNFVAYHTWAWREPGLQYKPDDPRIKSDLTEQRIREAVGEQMVGQLGLQSAKAAAKPDLWVQVWLIVDDRQNLVTTNYGGYWGGYWRNYRGASGYTETQVMDYKVGTIQVDFFDGTDGKLVWRGQAEQTLRRLPPSIEERIHAIHEAVAKVLSQYPPR